VALDVFPYNTAPLIHQSENFGERGYYLGIDAYGHVVFTVNGNSAVTDKKVMLYTWTHVAASIADGKMKIFIDGLEAASSGFKGDLTLPKTALTIGRNTDLERCTDFVRTNDQNLLFIYGIQGLIDEVVLYDQGLTQEDVIKIFSALVPTNKKSDLAPAVLPGEVGVAEKFGASYKKLKYQEIWDNLFRTSDYPDIVVKFENNPGSVVYWRGTNMAASWVTDNNRWMADQSSEIFTKHGCSEHMADKQLRHSYARIIENTPARVVIHWRYPCVDVSYYCADRRNWSDEYHTIYPDGIGVRKVTWDNVHNQPGFQDIQFFTNPGEKATDVMNLQAMTLANTDGDVLELVWEPPNNIPKNTLKDATIELLNSKSEYKVFTVFQGGYITPWGANEQSKYTEDPFAGPWNHWPIHLVPSDGRFAVAQDRVTHFAIGANDYTPEFGSMVLYGFTDQPITKLINVAKSWQNPASITRVRGASTLGFNQDERAFVLRMTGREVNFTVTATDSRPVMNPCFVVKDWNSEKEAEVLVNGKTIIAKQGIVPDTDGSKKLVVWLEYRTMGNFNVIIK